MRRSLFLIILFLLFGGICRGYLPNPGGPLLPSVTVPVVAISSYFNAADPRDEWSELLVTADNTDMRNWTFGDNNASQGSFQPVITFNNISLWNNLRAGTVIMIWHRSVSAAGVTYPVDADKSDGYIEVAANDPAWFTGGTFGTNPNYNGATLNIAGGGDLLELLNGTTFIHALGHKFGVGLSWGSLPATPKLNYAGSLSNNEAVFVCPGSILDEYGTTTPQDGTQWTSKAGGTGISFGLPNSCNASSTANSDFWRTLRQPGWIAPSLTGTVDNLNTTVTLTWNAATDPNSTDGFQGYIILRNTANTFTNPADGHTYAPGDALGSATVLTVITSSQVLTYADNTAVPCTDGYYYRIYAYRYSTDNSHGNDYDPARGRAYNETGFGETHVTFPAASAPTSATSDRNNFCADDPGNIELSAAGGLGTILNWYTDNCGGTLIGAGTGANNSLIIPSPAITTTYFARWENACGNSPCTSVTVTVLPQVPVSVSITASDNPVCQGLPVTFTAVPVNPGTSPAFQWKVNGADVGTGGTTYTYTPANGDDVMTVLTSNEACTAGNPASSNHIIMDVSTSVPMTAIITAYPGTTVCAGTTVTYTAANSNWGTTPSFQWYLNGNPVGSNSSTYSNVPVDGDAIYCVITSSLSCVTGNPATSNTLTITISAGLPVTVTVSADPGNVVCAGTTVTYTASPGNGGTAPLCQWYLNGNPVGTNSLTFSNIPVDGDQVYCVMTSSLSCVTGNPATSGTITITISAGLPVSVTVAADPGNVVCAGTPVTFTATPMNEGTAPAFQWYLNGNPAGTGGLSFTNTPADGDAVYCVVTSSLGCVTGNPATSNTVTIMHTPPAPVSVTISADPGDTICSGTTVTYTAVPVNEGTAPQYQWFLNGNPAGGNSLTWSNTPADGDVISCTLTSNLSCVTNNPAGSNTLTIVHSTSLQASVSVSSDHTSLCPGNTVTFTATAVNGGNTTTYEWVVGGVQAQQGNSPVFTASSSVADQPVTCRMTSSLTCLAANPVESIPLTIPLAPPPYLKLSDKDHLCTGTPEELDAGGGFSAYLWQDGSTGRYFTATEKGIYWVHVTDTVGCSASDSIRMLVCNNSILLPSAFSPNGDGINDIFRVVTRADNITGFSMIIFNRWGEEIFVTNDILKGWDGTFKGQLAPGDTYAWTISYRIGSDDTTIHGTVMVVY